VCVCVCVCVYIDHSCLIQINGLMIHRRMDGFVQANLNQFQDRNPNRSGQMEYGLRVSPGSVTMTTEVGINVGLG